jgi:maleylacetate reductase
MKRLIKTMPTYKYLKLDQTIMGVPLAQAVCDEVDRRGVKRVLLVISRTLNRSTDLSEQVSQSLGDRYAGCYDSTVTHVPRESVTALCEIMRKADADLVLTVGGGTCLDSVKMALLCLAENITNADQLEHFAIRVNEAGERETPHVSLPPLRQIAAPTTLSGAEFSDLSGCVDTSTQVKQLFSGAEIGPATVILDPAITTHTPMDLWLSTGVRALDHAVETVCSSAPMAIADAGALHAVRLLGQSLKLNMAEPDNLEARLDSQVAIPLACAGLNRVPYGASHGIGHQLGAVAGVPHGYTSCILLPHVMAFNAKATGARLGLISEAFGNASKAASESVAELVSELGMPTRLRDVGVTREHFEAIAEGSLLNAWVRANPEPINHVDQVYQILEAAY